MTRLINTLIPHFYEGEMSGTVLIDGVDTRTIQPHDLSDKIGSVFQNPRSQFFSLDTDSEIVFGMENKGMPYQVMLDRYQQTIRELHIEKLKDRNLFDLSGGQKQTIAFASVYALNPDIFVLDEPSSNLDPEAIQELRRLLLLIKAQGKTIIVSEHRLYFLNGIADRIVLMEHGKLKQSWSASDFDLLSTEQIKALGLRSYTPTRLDLPETTPSRNDTPAVKVRDLVIGYEKGEPVAQHLNFCVYPGEVVGVVGKMAVANQLWPELYVVCKRNCMEKFYTKTVRFQVNDGSRKRILLCRTRTINCLLIAFTKNYFWHCLTKRIKMKNE